MVEDITLLRDLAIVLIAAGVTAITFHRLHLPPVLGYLVAGLLVGPHIPFFPVVHDVGNIGLLAQLGVLFLLFSLGLHFHLGKLRRVGGLAFTAGILEVALMVGVGFAIARLFQWRTIDAIFLGAILAISSTTIIVKVLSDLGRVRAPSTEAIFGILLVEDVVAIVLIALLSSLALTGTVSAVAVGSLVARIAIFVVATLVLGLVVVPRLVDFVARLGNEEVLVLFVLGIAFGTTMIAVALDLSIALGAFIAGAVIAESRASATVARRVEPLRDVFAAVFFVSMGILVDPGEILAYWPAILILTAVCIVGKILAVGLATFVAGFPPREAVRIGIGMAMIGEFSFVIATLGRDLNVTASFLFPIAVSVSALTALVTPFLIRRSDGIADRLARIAPAGFRRYAATYSAWVSRMRPREGEAYSGSYDIAALLRALSYIAIFVALLFTATTLHAPVVQGLGGGVLFELAYDAVVVLVCVPIVVGLARAVRTLVDNLVRGVVPAAQEGTTRGAAVASVLRRTLYVFLAIVLGAVAVAAGAAFVPPLPLLGGAILLVGVASFFLRGALRRLDRQLEDAVDSVFRADAPQGQRHELLTLIRERYPWDLHVRDVIVPNNSRASHRRIRDLQLPQRTGATIVRHEREGRQSVNPAPDLLIAPGDTLGVLGEEEQVAHAIALLTEDAPIAARADAEADVTVEEIEIQPGSPMSGVTLAGSRIRETTGASVVGLRREGVPILNPAPVMRLRPGDAVLVIGSPAQVKAVRDMFAPRAG